MSPAPSGGASRLLASSLFASVVVVVVVAIVYGNSLPNGFTFDDHPVVVDNPVLVHGTIQDVLTSPFWPGQADLGLYRPLTLLSYAINRSISGTDPYAYHLTNVVLHGVTCVMLVLLLSQWFGRSAGLVGGLVFAVHPALSEAVNAIVGRAELLAGGCVVAAWYAHHRSEEVVGWRILAVVLYALGCLAKEHAILLPAMIVAERMWLYSSGSIKERVVNLKSSLTPLAPYAAVVVAVLMLRYSVIGSLGLPRLPDFVDNPLAHADTLTRLWSSVAVFGRYARLVLLPVDLSADYTYNQIPAAISLTDPFLLAGWFTMVAILTVVYRSAQGESGGVFGFGFVVFLVAWLPISNLLVAIGTPMNDRLLYLPMIGFAILVGAGYGRLEEAVPTSRSRLLVALVCLVMGTRTVIRNADWQDDFTLFESATQVSRDSAKAHFNFGNALRDRGNLAGALDAYGRAIAIYPGYAEVSYNQGIVLKEKGETGRAIDAYRAVLKAEPDHVNAMTNLGIALARNGENGKAISYLERAETLAPDRQDVVYNLAIALRDHDTERFAEVSRRALVQWPGFEDVALILADFYRTQDRTADAIKVLARTVQANSSATRSAFNLAVLQEQAGRFVESLDHYRLLWSSGEGVGQVGQISRYQMGTVFAGLNQTDSARVALSEFLDVWAGDDRLTQRAQSALDALR
ncbi:MAG: hypothetical protein CME19_24795 [Gemmatimonadetes bacterium]|nr:hypothetical protein [Gemmatimonadota bacterium]